MGKQEGEALSLPQLYGEQMNTQTFKLPSGLLQGIADYLGTRPFNEVVNLMTGLQYAEEVKEDDKTKDESK